MSIKQKDSIPYGIIVNKLSKPAFKKLSNNKDTWIKNINVYLDEKTDLLQFLPEVEAAIDEDMILIELPELIDFINTVPCVDIKKKMLIQ